MDPKNLRFAASHEWVALDQDIATIGISRFAVDQLTDVTHLELPKPGAKVSARESMGEIESVKAVSDLYAPLDGEIVESNRALLDNPGLIGEDPYGQGWITRIRVAPGTTLDHLLTHADYEQQIAASQ